jgi:DUF4097 and DUF4098 domain-containing protein YvlB
VLRRSYDSVMDDMAAQSSSITSLSITSRSGAITVHADDVDDIVVHGATAQREADGSTTVSGRGSSAITVTCPVGSFVTIGTSSGTVELTGRFAGVHAVTGSGNVVVDRAASVDVRTASGMVQVTECTGTCRVVTGAGNVRVERAGQLCVSLRSGRVAASDVGSAEVRTVSGNVVLGALGRGEVDVRSVSGSVDVSVPDGMLPDPRLSSRTGRVRCDCPTGTDGTVRVQTVSGSIRVTTR